MASYTKIYKSDIQKQIAEKPVRDRTKEENLILKITADGGLAEALKHSTKICNNNYTNKVIAVAKSYDYSNQDLKTYLENIQKPKYKENFTFDTLEKFLLENDIQVKFNEISKDSEVITLGGFENVGIADTEKSNQLPMLIYDRFVEMRNEGAIIKNCNLNIIERYLSLYIAKSENRYNPVLNYIRNKDWDKVDRLQDIYNILGVSDTLSKILINSWFKECICALYAGYTPQILNPDSEDSSNCKTDELIPYRQTLILKGPQRIGKSSFFRTIGSKWFKGDFQPILSNKDDRIEACKYWITELSEFDTVDKNNKPSELKSFISSVSDVNRLPYAPKATANLRQTVFCGTVNADEFLSDVTGNTRYIVIDVKKIDFDLLNKLDVQQLWAQIHQQIKDDAKSKNYNCNFRDLFELNSQDMERLEENNKKYMCKSQEAILLDEIIEKYGTDKISKLSAKEFYNLYFYVSEMPKLIEGYKTPSRIIAKALAELGYIPITKLNNANIYKLPVPDASKMNFPNSDAKRRTLDLIAKAEEKTI